MIKVAQSIALFFVIGSLASTTAAPIHDWEEMIEENGAEDGVPRALFEERSELLADADNDPNEVVEVAMPAKRQNFAARPRKDLALVPLQGKRVGDIADETQTTGENAKKRLPSYVRQNQPVQPSILHDIRQVTTNLLPMDFQGNAD